MSAALPFMLGDMLVTGGQPPAKLTKALAVIATDLHPALDRVITPGWSQRSCVLASLTARNFLRGVGIRATVAPVFLMIRANDLVTGKEAHSVGCGDHAALGLKGEGRQIPSLLPDSHRDWHGHMVVLAEGWLIDTTLYQAHRPQWPHLSGMIVTPTHEGLPHGALARLGMIDGPNTVALQWLDQPHNTRWKGGRDTALARRAGPVAAMVEAFGAWEDAP